MPADERSLRPPDEVCPVKGPGHLTTAAMQVDTGKPTAPGRLCSATPLRRRGYAADRCVPLPCGCRDPWPCCCGRPPLSRVQTQAAVDAARHLLAKDLSPVFDVPTLQAMWRTGHRELAEELAR